MEICKSPKTNTLLTLKSTVHVLLINHMKFFLVRIKITSSQHRSKHYQVFQYHQRADGNENYGIAYIVICHLRNNTLHKVL